MSLRHGGQGLAALARSLIRLLPWWHGLAGWAIAAAYVGLHVSTSEPGSTNVARLVWVIRIGMIPLAATAAFVFDDPTESWLATTPVSVRTRRLLRLALFLPIFAIAWLGLLALAASGVPDLTDSSLPLMALSIEFSGLLAIVIGVAGIAMRRRGDTPSGMWAGPAAPVWALIAATAPAGLVFWPDWVPAPPVTSVTDPDWQMWLASHQRWLGAITIGLAAVWWSARDRGGLSIWNTARRRIPMLTRPQGGPTAVDRRT